MIRKTFKFALLLFSWSMPIMAAEPDGSPERERTLLPPYCQDVAYWRSILGPDIGWNNHTCYGIDKLNRYYKSTSPRERKVLLQNALDDFNYSVGHLKPDFKLMPEIYFYRGTTYKLLSRNGEAVGDFIKTISLDPKYVKAYSELADVYASKLSQRGKALEIVTEGLRHNPGVKALQRRYTEFGGRLPYPEPLAKPEPVKPPIEDEADPVTKAEADLEQAKAAETEAGPKVEEPKIGSPTNPYCRFCPD